MSGLNLLSSNDDYIGSLFDRSLTGLVADNEGIVILEVSKELSEESREWLLNLLKAPLADGGVELEVRKLVEYKKQVVYHVGAGMKRMVEGAELMRLKKRYADDSVRDFNVDEFFLFSGTDDMKTIFSSKEKQTIILHEIESIRYHKRMEDTPEDLPDFYEDQAIFSCLKHKDHLNFFPLHDKTQLNELNKKWITNFFGRQPLDLIHSYFGDSVAFYFAFLGFYTKWLVVPALLGLIFQLLSFFISNSIVGIFCIFNIIWTSVFLVLWKRKCSELAFRWGTTTYSKYDEPRAEFRGTFRGQSAVTGRVEPLCNSRSKYYRFYSVSLPIILICLVICILLGVAYFWIDGWVLRSFNAEDPPTRAAVTWTGTIISISVTCVYGAIMYFIDTLYRKVAVKLNDYENHRIQSTYDNFLIVKLVVFNVVNYFFSLFYVAFCLQDFQMLSKDLATLLITWQVIQQFQEALLPYYAYKLKKRKIMAEMKKMVKEMDEKDGGKDGEKDGEEDGGVRLDVMNVYQVGKDSTKDEYPGTLDDFLELFLQFGYVFLFSAVFPTAAFWAFLNNLTEIRADGFKLCYIHRRPFVTQCQGIGAWLTAFELMGVLAVVTNCALVAMAEPTQEFFIARGWDSFKVLVFFVVVEHLLLFTKASISSLVPSTPNWVKVKMDRIEHEAAVAWKEKRAKELRLDSGSIIDKKLHLLSDLDGKDGGVNSGF